MLISTYIKVPLENCLSFANRRQRRSLTTHLNTFLPDNFGYFFNCTDTDGALIWRHSNTTVTSIEYRTTMYITNVRLREPQTPGEFAVSTHSYSTLCTIKSSQ